MGGYPIPHMEAILRKLSKTKYVSTINFLSAYHQVKMKKKCRKYTEFTYRLGPVSIGETPLFSRGRVIIFSRTDEAAYSVGARAQCVYSGGILDFFVLF